MKNSKSLFENKNHFDSEIFLEVKNLTKDYKEKGIFKKGIKNVLKNVSFKLKKGECLGIIGESGSGKSTLGRLILGIEKQTSGVIEYNKKDINKKNNNIDISVVFQDYKSSVNPRFSVREIISEPLIINKKLKKENIEKELKSLLKSVGLSEEFLNRYPKELSGGQLQRICIARAISTKPKFILLDEAVSSLDVSIQVEILNILKKLKKEHNLTYIFITHDLLALTYICDSVIFFKDGMIIEKIDNIKDLHTIKNEYSKRLLEAVIEF